LATSIVARLRNYLNSRTFGSLVNLVAEMGYGSNGR
jgi:hypothetical protein